MKTIVIPAVCVTALLAASPALHAQTERQERGRSSAETECTFKQGRRAPAGQVRERRGRKMDCIVVRGYPSQDGRMTLRKGLEEDAKKGMKKTVRPSLKLRQNKRRTS